VPEPVKPIVALLYRLPEAYAAALRSLEAVLGAPQLLSEPFPFDFTEYYAREMGPGLLRRYACFERHLDPGDLAALKCWTSELESRLAEAGRRRVNLDPGYVTLESLVLASTKPAAHRIYLSRGIHAEVTLLSKQRRFEVLPWTYPDYRLEATRGFFDRVRALYREERRRGEWLVARIPG
jgi:hypothetical protein